MNNLLLSDRLVNQLFAEPTVVDLYNTEKVVPKMVLFEKHSNKLAISATVTPSTLAFMSRILIAGTRALGYLQLARPQTAVPAQQVLATLKTLAFSSGNYMMAVARPNLNTSPGVLQIGITQGAQDALYRIEMYDPVFAHLIATRLIDGTYRVTVEGDYNDLELAEPIPGGLLEMDPVRDFIIVLDGVTFPPEVLL
jgi:hypothetical protein